MLLELGHVKFFRRQLHNDMQPSSGVDYENACATWKSHRAAYRQHLADIRDQLPVSMQAFSDISLHDGIVVCATRPAPDTISIRIDATNNPCGPIGHFDLTFYGAIAVTGMDEILDDWWLCEEVHLSEEAAFDYRVLLSRSELHILANNVQMTRLPNNGTRSK